MIVLDASVGVDYVLNLNNQASRIHERLADEDVAIPQLFDVEVTQVIRRFVRAKEVRVHRAHVAISVLQALPFLRFDHAPLLSRVFELRDALTAYDAMYLALAEALDGTLLTRDTAFAGVPTSARVESW